MSYSTNINRVKQEMHDVKLYIKKTFDFTDEQYNRIQYETGLEYLATMFVKDPEGETMLACSEDFWNFWKWNWHKSEFLFVQLLKLDGRNRGSCKFYKHFHSIKKKVSIPRYHLEEILITK